MHVVQKFRAMVVVALSLLAIASTATAKYSGGSGTAQDPYRIATAADLIALGEIPDDYDKHFILTADIDLDPNLPGRKVFDKAVIAPHPDPNIERDFEGSSAGVFEGGGYAILHFTEKAIGLLVSLVSRARLRYNTPQRYREREIVTECEANTG